MTARQIDEYLAERIEQLIESDDVDQIEDPVSILPFYCRIGIT